MANVYTALPTADTCFASLKAALIAKYGAGNITFHYESTTFLIFTCSAILDKVIKIIKISAATTTVGLHYGDSWTSGSTIVNPVVIMTSTAADPLLIDLILGDNIMLLATTHPTSANYSNLIVLGKLTNNEFIAMGFGNQPTYSGGMCKLTNGAVSVEPMVFQRTFNNSANKLFKQDIQFILSTGVLLTDGAGAIITLPDIYNISQVSAQTNRLLGSNSYITSASHTIPPLKSSLVMEWA